MYTLSYNNNPEASWENNIHFEWPNFSLSASEYNLIPFDTFIEEIRYILVHQMPSHKLKWYSH